MKALCRAVLSRRRHAREARVKTGTLHASGSRQASVPARLGPQGLVCGPLQATLQPRPGRGKSLHQRTRRACPAQHAGHAQVGHRKTSCRQKRQPLRALLRQVLLQHPQRHMQAFFSGLGQVGLALPGWHGHAVHQHRQGIFFHLGHRPEAPAQGLRILAAEDNAVNQLVLSEFLRLEGALATFVDTGQAAIDRIKAQPSGEFDLILMDVQMPLVDGYEATRQIKAIAPDLVIIGQTAHAMQEEHQKCLQAGMTDMIVKPLDLDKVVRTIRQHVTRAS